MSFECALEQKLKDEESFSRFERKLKFLATGKNDEYDVVERTYKFNGDREHIVNDKKYKECTIRLRRVLRWSGQIADGMWEVRYVDRNFRNAAGLETDGDFIVTTNINLSSDSRGDTEGMIRMLGFRIENETITRVQEYRVPMYAASVLVERPWPQHERIRSIEWGRKTKEHINTVDFTPQIESSAPRGQKRRRTASEVCNASVCMPDFACQKKEDKNTTKEVQRQNSSGDVAEGVASELGRELEFEKVLYDGPKILGRGQHEDPKVACEEAVKEAIQTLAKFDANIDEENKKIEAENKKNGYESNASDVGGESRPGIVSPTGGPTVRIVTTSSKTAVRAASSMLRALAREILEPIRKGQGG